MGRLRMRGRRTGLRGRPGRAGPGLLAVLIGALAVGAIGVVVLRRDDPPAPPPPIAEGGINVIMTNEDFGIWPGGMARLPNGSFYVVYERIDPTAQAFGMVVPDLLEPPPGPEEHLAGFHNGPEDKLGAFDPGAAILPSGDVLVSWSNTAVGVYLLERREDGTLAPEHQLAPRSYSQATLGNVNGRVLITYNYIPPGDSFGQHYQNDVLVQTLRSATNTEDAVRAGGPAGSGTDGNQFRVNTTSTGNPTNPVELMVVWNRPSEPPGGDRTIWGARSPDDGVTWGQPFTIASMPGEDLVNPFSIWVDAAQELRVYFVIRHGDGGSSLGVAASRDHGRTWEGVEEVPVPEGTRGSPGRPVFVEVDGRVICLGSWDIGGTYHLGTFVVP